MPPQPRFDIICLGHSAVDYLAVVPHMPALDSKMEMLDFSIQGGGPAATAAVTAARLGAGTAFIGQTGDDEFGKYMLRELVKEGVDVSRVVRRVGAGSQFSFIMVDRKTGKRTIVWTRSELPPMQASQLDENFLRSCRVLHVDRHEPGAARRAAGWVHDSDGIVSMDAGTYKPEVEELLPMVDVLITSHVFARDATGEEDPALCARAMLRGRKIAGVTLGERGSWFATPDEEFHVPAFEVSRHHRRGRCVSRGICVRSIAMLGRQALRGVCFGGGGAKMHKTRRSRGNSDPRAGGSSHKDTALFIGCWLGILTMASHLISDDLKEVRYA